MRKLKKPYQSAMNGLEALQAFKENPLSLRLILMGKFQRQPITVEIVNIISKI
jgi:hypothetical protein